MMYIYVGTFIPHHCWDHSEMIVCVLAEQLLDDGFVIKHNSIPLPFVHILHRNSFLHPPDLDPCDAKADTDIACLHPEEPSVRTHPYGTPRSYNRLTVKTIRNKYFDILEDEIDLWSPLFYEKKYRLEHWCVKHNLSPVASKKLCRDPTMATVNNTTLFHCVFKRLDEMFYAMGIDYCKSGNAYYNTLADPNILCDDEFTPFFYRNPVECIEFLIHWPAFRKYIKYALEMKFNEANEHIDSEVKSSDWCWNQQVCDVNFITATIILTASITTVGAWCDDCPFIEQFWPDTSQKLFRQQERMSRIYGSQKHQLDE